MTARDHLFLLTANRSSGMTRVEDLGHDVAAAMATYAARERQLASEDGVEVVLVSSASRDSLRRTHSSYFGGSAARLLGAA